VKRILFVDDEPKVLDGLRRMLYPRRDEWHVVFASNGHQALQLLSESDYDVLVTDVRMPDMSGIELLQEVVNQLPRVVRLVLSGTTDPAIPMQSARLAHHYLVKPCDPITLRAMLDEAIQLREKAS